MHYFLIKILGLQLLLFLNDRSSFGQITYPDSCLILEFYYQDKKDKLDTLKEIDFKKGMNMPNSILENYRLLNLVAIFRNPCNQNIAIPGEVQFGSDFWVEGMRIDMVNGDTLEPNLAVDYLPERPGVPVEIVPPQNFKVLPYQFPLGFNVKSEGTYKFRLVFKNSTNYIPFDQWKTYYSNWIYLKLF